MSRRFLTAMAALLGALFSAQPASAQWLQAETQNFVIHAELDEEELRDVALHMEEFNRLLQRQMPAQLRPGRKFHIWLDGGMNRISGLFGHRIFSAARDWHDLPGAFAQYDPGQNPRYRYYPLYSAVGRFHLSNGFVRTLPYWLADGLPIYFATAYVDEGQFLLGAPDNPRMMNEPMSVSRIEELLTTRQKPESFGRFRTLQSANAVFTYLLLSDPANDALIGRYLALFNAGKSYEEAMAVFGDLRPLTVDMRNKMGRKVKLRAVPIDPEAPKQIFIRPMGQDEVALIVPRFRRLIDEDREDVAKDLRKLTERFPDSAETWYQYAAAEFALTKGRERDGEPAFGGLGFADNVLVIKAWHYSDREAWAAVNRALALDSGHPHANRLKAEIMLARMLNAGDGDDAEQFAEIRALLGTLVERPEEFPFAAVFNYQTYIEQGLRAPQEAFDAFGRAFLGSAGVRSFRYAYAAELVRRGEHAIARRLLESMLNDPRYSEAAQRALDQIPDPPV